MSRKQMGAIKKKDLGQTREGQDQVLTPVEATASVKAAETDISLVTLLREGQFVGIFKKKCKRGKEAW